MAQKARNSFQPFFCHFYSWLMIVFLAVFFYSWSPFSAWSLLLPIAYLEYYGAKSAETFFSHCLPMGYCLPFIHYFIKNKVKTTFPLHGGIAGRGFASPVATKLPLLTCPSIGNNRVLVYARCHPRSIACYPCKS